MPSTEPFLGLSTPDSKQIPYSFLRFLESPFFTDLGMLILRVISSVLIFHHGLDKVQNFETFTTNTVEKYFGFLPIPPFWTALAAIVEIVGSILLFIGLYAASLSALV